MTNKDPEPDRNQEGFSNAHEYAELTPAAGLDHNPAERASDVITERRRIGRVELDGVLVTHSTDNVDATVRAVQGCQIIAIEQVGSKDEQARRSHETLYTLLLSTQSDPAAVDQAFSDMGAQSGSWLTDHLMHALAAQSDPETADMALEERTTQAPSWLLESLRQLKGTDKQVVLLDIAQDHPDFPIVQAAVSARMRFAGSLVRLEPILDTRSALESSITAVAEEYEVRDATLRDQLLALVDTVGKQEKPPRVATLIGTMHYRVIAGLGEALDPAASARLAETLTKTLTLHEQAIEDERTTGKANSDLVDRALLSSYLSLPTFAVANQVEADEIVEKLDNDQVGRFLSEIDDNLVGNASHDVKVADLKLYLKSVAGIIRESPGA